MKVVTAKNAEKPITTTEKLLPEGMRLEIKPKPEAEKPRRGRPPKPTPLTWADFQNDPLCKMVDGFVVDGINSTFLANRTEKLKESKVGSALIYTIYYYTRFKPDHPLMILLICGGSTFSNVLKCMRSPKIGEKKVE